MLLPAFTGSGPSAFEIFRVGDDETVVVSSPPAVGGVSTLSMFFFFMDTPPPETYALSPHTPLPTLLDAPAARPPMFQVTTPAASVPPPVALTNAVLVGIVSAMTTPVAFWFPVFE